MIRLGREVISYDCGRDQSNELLPLVVTRPVGWSRTVQSVQRLRNELD